MGIQSNAHFGVDESIIDIVIVKVRTALQEFDAAQYGVSKIHVEHYKDASFVIKLELASTNADQADADAERATECIKSTLKRCFERYFVRERQRELTLD